MIGGRRPLLLEILGQTDRVEAKSPIFELGNGEGDTPPQPTNGSGERRELPPPGVRGQAPTENDSRAF